VEAVSREKKLLTVIRASHMRVVDSDILSEKLREQSVNTLDVPRHSDLMY